MQNRNKFTAEFAGKERTFWLGLGFLGLYLKTTGQKASEMQESIKANPFDTIPQLIFCSIKYGYDRHEAKCDLTKYDILDALDEEGGFTGPFVTLFMEKLELAMSDPQKSATKEPGQKKTQPAKGKSRSR